MQITGYRGEQVDAVKILALRPLQFVPKVPVGANILEIGTNHRHQILAERVCDAGQAASVIRLWNKLSGG